MTSDKVVNMIVSRRGRRATKKQSGYLSKAQAEAARVLYKPIAKLEIGAEYIVSKHWAGTFKARLLAISEMGRLLQFIVTDAMRPGPLIEDKCSFPECTAEEFHDGDHQFSEFRNGAQITVTDGTVDLRPAVIDRAISA